MAGFGWANVADDLLFLLAEKMIGVPAFVRFSAVCKPWHFVASATRCKKQVPWLMMIENEGSDLRDFYDHSTRELYEFPLPHMERVKNLGFANGRLISAKEDCTFHLVNPLSHIQISLPPAPFITNYEDEYANGDVGEEDLEYYPYTTDDPEYDWSLLGRRNLIPVKAICSPIGPNGDCIVALTYRGDFDFGFSFCRSTDEDWTVFENTGSSEVAFIDGVFYTISNFGGVLTFDFTSAPKLTKIADLPRKIIDCSDCHTVNSHIVKCADAILIAVKIYGGTTDIVGGSYIIDFFIYKLDIEGKKVEKIESIGDYSLLFGTNNSFCLPTLLYGGFFKRNCIYFTNVDEFTNFDLGATVEVGEDIMVYNLDDKSFTTHSVGMAKSTYSYPIWVSFDPTEDNILT